MVEVPGIGFFDGSGLASRLGGVKSFLGSSAGSVEDFTIGGLTGDFETSAGRACAVADGDVLLAGEAAVAGEALVCEIVS